MIPQYVTAASARPPRPRNPPAGAQFAHIVVVIAALSAFFTVFTGTRWFAELAVFVVACALLAQVLRAAPLYLAAATATLLALVYRGIPHSLTADLAAALDEINSRRAPIDATRGIVLALGTGLIPVVLAGQRAARANRLGGVLAPAAALYAVAALYGRGNRSLGYLALFVGAAGLAALASRPHLHARGRVAGAAVVALALAGSIALGPSLPGAREPGVIAVRDLGDGWFGSTGGAPPNAFVSVRAQLVDQSDREMFTVDASRAEYWRLSALDTFDGIEWTASQSASLIVPAADDYEADRYTFTVEGLRGKTLPSVLEPVAVAAEGTAAVAFDARSSTLSTDRALKRGHQYTLFADAPSRVTLSGAETAALTQLPAAARTTVASLARQIARDANATSPAARARALERWFLANFRYDLDVAAGMSIESMSDFLNTRVGYCEQFATTFAAMARSLGLPTRVVVGYLPGDARSNNSYVVRGTDAHAWPEVFVDGRGWVRYEPTPGRASSPAPAAPAAPATTAPQTTIAAPTTAPPLEPAGDELAAAPDTAPSPIGLLTEPGRRSWLVPLGAVTVIALVASGPLAAGLRRRTRRWRARRQPRLLTEHQWNEAVRSIRLAGLDVRASETPHEVATKAAAALPSASHHLAGLAQLTDTSRYSKDAPDPVAAASHARAIHVAVGEALGRRRWLRTWRRSWREAIVR